MSLASELEHVRRVLSTKLSELSRFQTEREALLARIAERDLRIQKLEAAGGAEVPKLKAQLQDLEAELTALRSELGRLSPLDAEAAALRARASRLDAALAEKSLRVSELESELERERAKRFEQEARVRALESELADSLAWAPARQDDLTRIKGIGPKFRDALLAAGVKTFAEIASWSESDVEGFAAKLRIQAARIRREGWVEAAKTLDAQGQRTG